MKVVSFLIIAKTFLVGRETKATLQFTQAELALGSNTNYSVPS